jgi:O-acetyl-ADP-ribose deacetylase (regulator of RNase III)
MDFKLTLVDPKEHLIEAWKKRFSIYPNVSYHHGKFEELEKYDCLINAGNGFGMMDGGVDYAISDHFGWDLQERVQGYIRDSYYGEQPVGTSFLISTNPGEEILPLLAHTPTMRAPAIIRNTDNVYQAFRAALIAITKYNSYNSEIVHTYPSYINSVVCMGLGTSCGGVDPEDCAQQMYLAYRNMINPVPKMTWPYIKRMHREISTDAKGTVLDYMTP